MYLVLTDRIACVPHRVGQLKNPCADKRKAPPERHVIVRYHRAAGAHTGIMATLSFSLVPAALIRLHDALICLSKFNESVFIEAEYDLVSSETGRLSRPAS